MRILKAVAAASVIAVLAVGCGGDVKRNTEAARKGAGEAGLEAAPPDTGPTGDQAAQPATGTDTGTGLAPAPDASGAAPADSGAAATGLPATAAPGAKAPQAKAGQSNAPAAGTSAGPSGSGGGAKPDASGGSKSAAAAPAPAPGAPTPGTPGVVTDVGISDTSIKVGMPFGLGGALGPFFKDLEKPAIAVLREANDAGGINGRKFQWTLEDTRWDVNTGTSAIKKLVEQDKVAYLVGWEHYTCNASGAYVDQVKVPLFGCEGAADDQYKHPYLFPSTCSSFRTWSHVAGKYITEHMGKSVYVVTHNTPGNTAGLKEFQYAVEQGGGKVVGVSQVPFDNADYTPQVIDIRQKNPDVVYNWVHPDQTVKLYLALQRQNYFPKILNGNEALPQGVWRGIGDKAKGALMLSCNSLVKHATGFVQTTTRYYPQTSSTLFGWSMYGYGGAKALVEGLRRSGKDMSREGVRNALFKGQPVDMGGVVPGAGLTYKPGNPPPNHFGTWLYSWDGNDYVDESKDFLIDPYPARTTNF